MVKRNQKEQTGQREAQAQAGSGGVDPAPVRESVTVPDVLRMHATDAVASLRNAGLRAACMADSANQVDADEASWEVRFQDPAAGAVVFASSTVALYSLPMVVVPDVVGKPVYDAIYILTQHHLTATCESTDGTPIDTPRDDWYVHDQNPKAGDLVSFSSNVALIIAAGVIH